MARRFSDTEKWENPKFRTLPPELKALYFWMLDTWPHNGFRHLDLGLCSFQVGFDVSLSHVEMTGFRLFTNGERFFFPAFVLSNQSVAMFCELNPANKAHQGILKAISEEGLSEFCEALDNGNLSPVHAAWKPLESSFLAPSK